MKKNISLIATALLIATASLFCVSCKDEFQVEESQIYGKWYFPLTLAPDTVTMFNWAGNYMTITPPDTLRVQALPGKNFKWYLQDNNVTAICKPRANVDESWIIAFTVYDVTSSTMKIAGKYRYQYGEDNTVHGDLSCTLTRSDPNPAPEK